MTALLGGRLVLATPAVVVVVEVIVVAATVVAVLIFGITTTGTIRLVVAARRLAATLETLGANGVIGVRLGFPLVARTAVLGRAVFARRMLVVVDIV